MQSSHYTTCFAWLNIQFFVLPSITRECDPKILELLHLLQRYSPNLHKRTLNKIFWKLEYLSFGSTAKLKAIFLILHLPIVTHLSYRFGWVCPSSSCKLWKEMTKHGLIKAQHLYEITLIAFDLHENKIKFRLTVKWLYGHQQMLINAILLQHSLSLALGNQSNVFFTSTKHSKTTYAYSQDFL